MTENITYLPVETTKFPSAITSYLELKNIDDDDCYMNGGILNDNRYAWLSCGPKFCVVELSTGYKIAAWTFGATFRDFNAKITCVAELPDPLAEHTLQLLIGLECQLIGGMVCLFHCNGSRVLRAIQVDCQIMSLQYIDKVQSGVFTCYDGTVIIGTQGGGVYVLDLNRETCREALVQINSGIESTIRDEQNIANLVVLSIDNINIINQQRSIACQKDHHIAVQINEASVHNLHFVLYNPDNTVKVNTKREDIFVSSLLYIPQLTSVIVGYNIGVFQLWNMSSLNLEFTSQLNEDRLPVKNIGFLEPCDDPRAFCYIWIIYSTLDRHEEKFPLAAMYSLTYQAKKHLDEDTYLYHKFVSCNLRFNIELSNTDNALSSGKQFIGGRCLGYQTLMKKTSHDDTDEYTLNVCQIVWECWTISAITPVQTLMFIFDIDQWYKEQMPEICELKTNNYMSVVNVSETIMNADSYLCDVKINKSSLTSYMSVQKLEEHFYPNSLDYECLCLFNTEIKKFSTIGVQRQLLATISSSGPTVLLHPTKLFKQCINTGLIPLYVEINSVTNMSEHLQRQVLLSIALEARLIQFLGKCAGDWGSGNISTSGCNLQLLLEWSWNRACVLKQNGDRLTVPLFNLAGEILDHNSVQQLDSCVRQLGLISTLFSIVIEKCSSVLLPEKMNEIMHRQNIIKIVAQYFQVIQWFLDVGLLPECSFDQLSDNDDHLSYPIESLVQFYQNRRLKLHCLNGKSPALEDLQNKSCDLLYIDQFIKEECAENKLKQLWIDDQSVTNGLYPPPSLHSLLQVYLIPEIKEEHKHSLVLYILVDYAMIFDDKRYEGIIRRLMQFPTMFGLSSVDIKTAQAFWHLDHRDFQLALNQLQCVLASGVLTQWQHNVVLSALLVQKKTQSALQYLHVRKPNTSVLTSADSTSIYDDWDACSNLYLSRGLVYEAFNFNKHSNKDLPADVRKLRLKIFFEGCRKLGLLSKVALLPLTQFEENEFVTFLKTVDNSHSNDVLVLYYLRRSRYIEANQINEELKRFTCKDQLPYDVTSDFTMQKDYTYKTEARDQLVNLYCKTLPPITRQLAHLANSSTKVDKMVLPIPMTVQIQSIKHKTASYKSSLIQATIEKASETWMRPSEAGRSLKRPFQIEDTPFLCTPKMMKHSHYDEEMRMAFDESSPPKRIKLHDGGANSSSKMNDMQNLSPKVKSEIDNILHTPLIQRKSTSKLNAMSPIRRNSFREATPQSILKVKKRQFMNSPLDEKYLLETDDELETASQFTQSDNLSRSIRFNIPSRNQSSPPTSECASDIQDSYNELCCSQVKNVDNRTESPVSNISARRSIHDRITLTPRYIHKPHLDDAEKIVNSSNNSLSSMKSSSHSIRKMSNVDMESSDTENEPSTSRVEKSISNRDTIEMMPQIVAEVSDRDEETSVPSGSNDICESSNAHSDDNSLKGDIHADNSDVTKTEEKIVSESVVSLLTSDTSDIAFDATRNFSLKSVPTEEDSACATPTSQFYSNFMQNLISEKSKSTDLSTNAESAPIAAERDDVLQGDSSVSEVETSFTIPEKKTEGSFEPIEEITSSEQPKNINTNMERKSVIFSTYVENNENIRLSSDDEFPEKAHSSTDMEYTENIHSLICVEQNEDNAVFTTYTENDHISVNLKNYPVSEEKDISNMHGEPDESSMIANEEESDDKETLPAVEEMVEVQRFEEVEVISRVSVHKSFEEDKPNSHDASNISVDIETTSLNNSSVSSTRLKIDLKTSEEAQADSVEYEEDSRMSSSRRSIKNSSTLDTLSQSFIDSDQESTTSSKRKSRRSVLPMTKPNLSVIPEMSQVDSEMSAIDNTIGRDRNISQNISNVIDQYSSSRRLTRHQRSMLEKSLESSQPRRASSITEIPEEEPASDNDSIVSQCSSLTERTLDPIFLLDKPDFDGQPDMEENVFRPTRHSSRASSVVSDITDFPKDKPKKIHNTPKKINDSKTNTSLRALETSIDLGTNSITDSPSSRPRRQSFNKAIEAICTPKRKRRTSIDSKKSDCDTTIIDSVIPEIDIQSNQSNETINQKDQSAILVKETEVITEEPPQSSTSNQPKIKNVRTPRSVKSEIINKTKDQSLSDIKEVDPADEDPQPSTSSHHPRIKSARTPRSVKSKKALSVHGDKSVTDLVEGPRPDTAVSSTSKSSKKTSRNKAASIHGDEIINDKETEASSPPRRLTRQSIFLTPLSKEEQIGIGANKQRSYRKKSGTHKVVQPLQFALHKK